MKPGGRLQAAIEVLADIEARHRPVSDALRDWGLSHRFAGSGDRAAIGNLVYDALRWRASTAFAMESEAPRALILGVAGRRWGLGAEGLAGAIAGDPHAPERLSDEEARLVDAVRRDDGPDHIRADIPAWIAPLAERALGAGWVAECEALAARPPLDIRANRLKAGRDRVLKALQKFGAAAAPFAPDGIRIAATEGGGRHPNVQVEPAFQKGWFEIQDEGSQLAALLVGAEAGQQVLDLCAGAGGKTLAMSAMMENRGQIFATDRDRQRLAPIVERLKRAGTRNVQLREAGAALGDLDFRMDRVLVDAPCTGTGTWRRRPDAKWRLSERALGERTAEQAALLEQAAVHVRPGGRLVYVTCSILAEENEDRVRAFAAARPDFEIVPGDALIAMAGLAEGARERLAGATLRKPEGVRLTPARTGTDGFFVAALTRRG